LSSFRRIAWDSGGSFLRVRVRFISNYSRAVRGSSRDCQNK